MYKKEMKRKIVEIAKDQKCHVTYRYIKVKRWSERNDIK